MGGPKSWGLSILLGLAGSALGYLIFKVWIGIGDDDVFDLGGVIGVVILLLVVKLVAGRREAPRYG
jgi:uncharacterized membrane protein YeaQ/YmgE (transglycosylase-associated protein family)